VNGRSELHLIASVCALLTLAFMVPFQHDTKAQGNPTATNSPLSDGLPWNEQVVAGHYGDGHEFMWGAYGNKLYPGKDYFCALPSRTDSLDCLGGLMACRMSRCDDAKPTLDELLESGIDAGDPATLPFEYWPGEGSSLGELYGWVIDGEEGDGLFRVIQIKPSGKDGPVLEAYVADVGPWCTEDPYWEDYSRPDAESGIDARGRRTNRGGIDLSYALARALGFTGLLELDWRWKTLDGAYVVQRRSTEWR